MLARFCENKLMVYSSIVSDSLKEHRRCLLAENVLPTFLSNKCTVLRLLIVASIGLHHNCT